MFKEKRGQMKLSFGMIFSIILIIVFIAFAFYVIMFFFNLQDNANIDKLANDIQKDVDRVWKSAESSQIFSYDVPEKIDYLCFVNLRASARGLNSNLHVIINRSVIWQEGRNLVFYEESEQPTAMEFFSIEHIDLNRVIEFENPYCIRKIDGKTSLEIKKGFQDTLVYIERNG